MIPKIIHQVWEGKTGPLPKLLSHLSETWKEFNPQWRYEFWDGDRIDSFIQSYYPQYMDMYRSFPYHVQRWDAIRYLILDKIGGLYVDYDYESIKPVDSLVEKKKCCFAMEADLHCHDAGKHEMFNNALMFSVPCHSFMRKIIDSVFSESLQKSVTEAANIFTDERSRKNHIVLHSTGPWLLMNLYESLSENEKSEIYLIPAKYVSPFNIKQVRLVFHGTETEELESCLAESYAVHYYFGLWREVVATENK